MYIAPEFGATVPRTRNLREGDGWFKSAKKLTDLSQLREMATAMAREWQDHDETMVVGDVVMNERTSIVRVGRRDIKFRPIDADILKKLVLNSGVVLSGKQLLHTCLHCESLPGQLRDHIWEIRRRLGLRLRERVKTVAKHGYMYQSLHT